MATVKISTTLYKSSSVTSKKLGVMKPGETVLVYKYNHYDWFCKCQHPKFGWGWALYFINGNVHISGSGVTAAIKANGGEIGNSKTGYQTAKKTTNKKDTKAEGIVKKAVSVRSSPSGVSKVTDTLKTGTKVTMTEINTSTGWCHVSVSTGSFTKPVITGYVQYKSSSTTWIKADKIISGNLTLKEINSNSNLSKNASKFDANQTAKDDESIEDATADTSGDITQSSSSKYIPEDTSLTDDFLDYAAFQEDLSYDSSATLIKTIRGIHAMPYQFSSIVDPKLADNSLYGQIYADRILTKMPLLILSPGLPAYMPNYARDDKTDLLTTLANEGISSAEKLLAEISGEEGDGKFYTFKHDYVGYFKYVTSMLQAMAIYLDIANKTVDTATFAINTTLGQLNWESYQETYLKKLTGLSKSVGFYVDSESQMSENFSNSTAESQFVGAINQVNDLSREIQFLMGGASGKSFEDLVGNNFEDAFDQIKNFTDKYVQVIPSLLMSRLKNTLSTIKVGGQLVFPEIWNDSDFGRSYDITIKLRTPNGDNFSWFMDIAVPLMHLLAFVLPRQLGYNGIQSPYLVRAFYRGQFNVSMGIISSMSISRGDKCKWNLQGLPLDVDVSLTIKDLYQSLSMSPSDDFIGLGKNVDQIDYLANLCGINVNKPDVMKAIELNANRLFKAGVHLVVGDGMLGLKQGLDKFGESLYGFFFR